MGKSKCASDLSSCGLFIVNNDPANDVRFVKAAVLSYRQSLCSLNLKYEVPNLCRERKKRLTDPNHSEIRNVIKHRHCIDSQLSINKTNYLLV